MVNRIELSTSVVQIKGLVQDSVLTPGFDMKHLKKCCEYNNNDEVNSPNILSNNNYQASSQKLRQKTKTKKTNIAE